MSRFNDLLEKRKNLTANIFEEQELIFLASKMSSEEIKKIDPELLKLSLKERTDDLFKKLDSLSNIINEIKET